MSTTLPRRLAQVGIGWRNIQRIHLIALPSFLLRFLGISDVGVKGRFFIPSGRVISARLGVLVGVRVDFFTVLLRVSLGVRI